MKPVTPSFQVPLLGQGPSQQQKQQAAVSQAIAQLSMQIYVQLAFNYLKSRMDSVGPRLDTLRDAAKHAQTAARCYFEGIGVIQEKEE